MKKYILLFLLTFLAFAANLQAAPPTYPIIMQELPTQPSLKATFTLTDGTILKNLLLLSTNEETDPGTIVLRFYRPPLKSSLYIKDLRSLEFTKESGERGLYEEDTLKLTLKSGRSDTVTYLSGLNDGFTVVYLDEFSGYHQKLYIPIYIKDPKKSDFRALHIKKVDFLD